MLQYIGDLYAASHCSREHPATPVGKNIARPTETIPASQTISCPRERVAASIGEKAA